jgi:hypothetical protein
MKRFLIALAALLALFVCASHCAAATPLPTAPAQGWCYDSFTTPNYNGVRACSDQPPPSDPGAYTNLVVTWMQTPPVARATDVTMFANVVGHILPALPIQPWPFASGTTVKWLDNSARYMRMRLTVPANPGTLSHFIKAVSYGPTRGIRARFALVPADAAWPTGADTACYKADQGFSDQTVLTLNPGAPNPYKCPIAAGGTYDVLIDALTSGTIGIAWN